MTSAYEKSIAIKLQVNEKDNLQQQIQGLQQHPFSGMGHPSHPGQPGTGTNHLPQNTYHQDPFAAQMGHMMPPYYGLPHWEMHPGMIQGGQGQHPQAPSHLQQQQLMAQRNGQRPLTPQGPSDNSGNPPPSHLPQGQFKMMTPHGYYDQNGSLIMGGSAGSARNMSNIKRLPPQMMIRPAHNQDPNSNMRMMPGQSQTGIGNHSGSTQLFSSSTSNMNSSPLYKPETNSGLGYQDNSSSSSSNLANGDHSYGYNPNLPHNIGNGGYGNSTSEALADLEKLRQELAVIKMFKALIHQTRLNNQQKLTLIHKENLLMQRKAEIERIDERISELKKRLGIKRMLNQELSSQMKSRTGVAYGLPADSVLNSGNPRLRSSVGPCSYNRGYVTNTNVAAVEPFQRSTINSNDENVDPMLTDISPSKQYPPQSHNLLLRNKFSPVELNSTNTYPPQLQHLSSPSKSVYQHPLASSIRESNNQKLNIKNNGVADETTISSNSERLLASVKEVTTGVNTFHSSNTVNNKNHLQQQQQQQKQQQQQQQQQQQLHQQHLHHLYQRYQLQHRDEKEVDDYEEDNDDHVSTDDNGDDNGKTIVESRSSSKTTPSSSTSNQVNSRTESSLICSPGDELSVKDAVTNKELSSPSPSPSSTKTTTANKRRPVIDDNKIEKELNVNPMKAPFERKPLNFQWPPPQYQSIDHQHQQQSKPLNKPDEGKKVTWAKKRILSKTTDDLRSPTKDSFCLKESQSHRPSSILLNNNRKQHLDNDDECDDNRHHLNQYHHHNQKLSMDKKKNMINTFVNGKQSNNHCTKIKSSLKKDTSIDEINQKKDHEGLTRRVSFDPLALLLDAALEGELDLVKKTSKIQDVSAANDEGITALHNTICAGHFDIVKYLVEIGCDVNASDSDGWTPLHCAASCNNLIMVKYLVEHGACIFATTFQDNETAAQKCEEGEEGFDGCSQYLLNTQDSLGIINDAIVYAVYDYDAQSSDELSFKDGDTMRILRREDEDEKDWWWARLNDKEGYIPRNLLGLYPRVKANKQDKIDAMD